VKDLAYWKLDIGRGREVNLVEVKVNGGASLDYLHRRFKL